MYMYIYKCNVYSLCTLYVHVHLQVYCTFIMYTLCTCTFTSVLYTHYVHFMYMYIYKGTVHSLCILYVHIHLQVYYTLITLYVCFMSTG